jgi:hypothetical protein
MEGSATRVEVPVPPTELARLPLVTNRRSTAWISDQVAAIIEGKTPTWWWIAFVPSVLACLVLFSMIVYQISTGVGVWGNNHPVMWGWDIINFVWWIGIGHAGTLISAILFLLRQRWRTGRQPRGRGHDHLRRDVRRHLSRPARRPRLVRLVAVSRFRTRTPSGRSSGRR